MSLQNPVFIPGPTNIPEALRKACDMPTLDHRSPAFARLFRPALEGVKRVLNMTEGEVTVLPSTGTGGWEAAISNTLSPGDTVLAARFGIQPPLDRPVPASWAEGSGDRSPLGRRGAAGGNRGCVARRHGPDDPRRSGDP
jgi:hypothetical protein